MPRIDWENQIGRRLRLRDLHVFSTVVRLGSMGKAAQALGVTQPAVSEVIADLEHALGVRLFDREPQGVNVTAYGAALERRSLAAFDELKQGIKDIEFLSDPTVGEVRIGCPESISAAILQPIIEEFTLQYPRVVLDLETVNNLSVAQKLRDRQLDVALARDGWPLGNPELVTDLNVETLCEDELVVAVDSRSRWARRRKIDIAELRNENWILTSEDRLNYQVIAKTFAQAGVAMPEVRMKTISVHVRANMVATGRFITTFPRSVIDLYQERFGLKVLPIALCDASWPMKIVTLRHRTLGSIVERFIACAKNVAQPTAERSKARKRSLDKQSPLRVQKLPDNFIRSPRPR
jgi:DNA-binding transcriptional LysR family regulator